MKIEQNPESGEVHIKFENDEEEYNIEQHLAALMEFVTKQAIEIHRLRKSYRKIVGRLDSLEIRNL
ncbi:hypothetical protein [Microcoleus sp. BROC3]|uniref:hypothetical protein n=1 Tax=Microcoleus sp. BROC3 TaxID=3055323 RepID=UPI002FD626D3